MIKYQLIPAIDVDTGECVFRIYAKYMGATWTVFSYKILEEAQKALEHLCLDIEFLGENKSYYNVEKISEEAIFRIKNELLCYLFLC